MYCTLRYVTNDIIKLYKGQTLILFHSDFKWAIVIAGHSSEHILPTVMHSESLVHFTQMHKPFTAWHYLELNFVNFRFLNIILVYAEVCPKPVDFYLIHM